MSQDNSTMENEIDNIINEASQGAAEEVVETPQEQVEDEIVEEAVEDTEADTEESPEAVEEDVPFPKKAVNALSWRDKKISKQNAELHEIRQQLEQMQRAQETQANAPKPPVEDDFDSYGEFIQAHTEYLVKKAMGNTEQGKQEEKLTPEQAQERQWTEERETSVVNRALELAESNPDYKEVAEMHSGLLDDISPELEKVFLSLDDPNAAFYNLAKEGKLEAVINKPIHLASAMLLEAERKGFATPKVVSKTPKPIAGSNGSGSANKELSQMSADELVNWVG